jgi:mono/diheme cytochrome c family protein
MTGRRLVCVLGVLGAAGVLPACGSQSVDVPTSETTHSGAVLFAEHCSGCHTLSYAGTQGSATNVRNRERVDGPNFDQRKEEADQVLYAIRNGGFSGAIMPENIVVGKEAQQIADFLAEYSGRKAKAPKGPSTG